MTSECYTLRPIWPGSPTGPIIPGSPYKNVKKKKGSVNKVIYHTIPYAIAKQVVLQYFLSFGGLSWGQSRVSFLSLGDKKHIYLCVIGNSNPTSAQPSNDYSTLMSLFLVFERE